MKILIAGGAGFIGSTIASACIDAGHTPIILDNLTTGRIEFTHGRSFYQGDIGDAEIIDKIFADHPDIYAAINCAALIVVPDSVARPLHYYTENVVKGLQLVGHLLRNNCTRLLFSSSASIYATPEDGNPVTEDSPLAPSSPYARTKAMFEQALEDIAFGTNLNVISLRYFNPIGCDPERRTGLQIANPSHALGKMIHAHQTGEAFALTGDDYPTRDGSGIRDYVHVWDLASAHLAALEKFDTITSSTGHQVINLGTGTGTTVNELISAFNQVTGSELRVSLAPRRPGDVAGTYPLIDRAMNELDWKPQYSIEQGISDSLQWSEIRASLLD